jgi:aminodeoxyfutalosine deaminase
MSIEGFIQAIPKAELNVRLEGAIRKDTLLSIAEQNDISESDKRFNEWATLLDKPDYKRLNEIIHTVNGWLLYPEDLTRVVYDVGVALARQNIKYAEVCVTPSLHMLPGMSFEQFLDALNDGRDRAQRGWGIQLRWVFMVARDEPRRADETMRWTSSAAGKRSGVVAFGVGAHHDPQPVGQFERAFIAAQKKDLPRVTQSTESEGPEGILSLLDHLVPSRMIDAWGAADAPDVLKQLAENEIPLAVSVARALCLDWVPSYAQYPLRQLYDEDVKLVISADMPELFKSTLTDEYLAVMEHAAFSLEELEELALNAVRYSFLPDEEKAALLADFEEAYGTLREEYITSEAGPT